MANKTDYELLLNDLYGHADNLTETTKILLHKPQNPPPHKRLQVGNLWLVFEDDRLVRLEIAEGAQTLRVFKVVSVRQQPTQPCGPKGL
jgi:hypothetical protein